MESEIVGKYETASAGAGTGERQVLCRRAHKPASVLCRRPHMPACAYLYACCTLCIGSSKNTYQKRVACA